MALQCMTRCIKSARIHTGGFSQVICDTRGPVGLIGVLSACVLNQRKCKGGDSRFRRSAFQSTFLEGGHTSEPPDRGRPVRNHVRGRSCFILAFVSAFVPASPPNPYQVTQAWVTRVHRFGAVRAAKNNPPLTALGRSGDGPPQCLASDGST